MPVAILVSRYCTPYLTIYINHTVTMLYPSLQQSPLICATEHPTDAQFCHRTLSPGGRGSKDASRAGLHCQCGHGRCCLLTATKNAINVTTIYLHTRKKTNCILPVYDLIPAIWRSFYKNNETYKKFNLNNWFGVLDHVTVPKKPPVFSMCVKLPLIIDLYNSSASRLSASWL